MMRADPSSSRPQLGSAAAESLARARAAQILDPGAVAPALAGDSALAPLRRQPSLTERVFRQLRDAIVKNELAPGALVSIEQLAGLLGVSRTPVREALPALQQLGLIVQTENGSFRVAPLNREYAWEVYAVRSAIESLAAEIVAPRLTDDDLSELRAIAVPHEPKPDGDYSEMFGPDLGLHDYIRQKCPLAFINALIDSIRFHRARLLHLEHSLDAAYRKASYEEHCAIVEALERRDGKAARRLKQEHLDRVGAAVAALAE
jgi:DNA-binding GntR family transcriptional regulator